MFGLNFADYLIKEQYEQTVLESKYEQSLFCVPLCRIGRIDKRTWFYIES